MRTVSLACLIIVGLAFASPHASAEEEAPLSIGLPERLEQVVLPGAELQVKPLEDRHDPFILRIVAVYPHGTDYRYDFEYYALEPGRYDVTDYLQRADGTAAADLPELVVEVDSLLPEGQIAPTPVADTTIRRLGGYRVWAAVATFLWAAGLFALIFVGRKQQDETDTEADEVVDEDRLGPLVRAARKGELPESDRAALERAVMAYWRDRLELASLTPAELSQTLRDDEQAGPMLQTIEAWLHAPGGDTSIDLDALLKPIDDQLRADEAAAASPVAQAAG